MKPNRLPKVLYNCRLLSQRKDSPFFEETQLINGIYARSLAEALKLAGITKIDLGKVGDSDTASISIEEIILDKYSPKKLTREICYRVITKSINEWV